MMTKELIAKVGRQEAINMILESVAVGKPPIDKIFSYKGKTIVKLNIQIPLN
jgi:hypothetical protein